MKKTVQDLASPFDRREKTNRSKDCGKCRYASNMQARDDVMTTHQPL